MKTTKKMGRSLVLGVGVTLGTCMGKAVRLADSVYGSVVQHSLKQEQFSEAQEDVEKVLESKLQDIKDLQEQKLGIKHFDEIKVSFKPSFLRSRFGRAAGSYDARNNTMWIDAQRVSWREEAMAHELGHAYHDKLGESRGDKNWHFKDFTRRPRVVTEGIAEYFGSSIFPKKNLNLSFNDFRSYVKIYDEEAEYEAGYRLVKPILDKDVNRGIELLTQNPLTKNDLEDLRAYQQKILNMMDKKQK